MEKERQGFYMFHDLREPMMLLSDEQRGKLIMLMLDYSDDGTVPVVDDKTLQVAFAFAKQSIDRGIEAFQTTSERRSASGKKGAEARWGSS